MKKFVVFIVALSSLSLFGQDSNIQIKFKAIEEAKPALGRAWDFSFNPLESPMNIDFNGEILKMYYDNGQTFWDINVLSYQKKEKKENGTLSEENYILKIEYKGFIQYLVIQKIYSYGDYLYQLKIPFVSETGETMSYYYYR